MNTLINVMTLRLKLIYRSPVIKVLIVVIAVLFGALISSLYAEAENSSKIPIGYVDESQSDFSQKLITNLHQNELLKPTETTLKDGLKKVNKGEITALFIIKADVEEKVYAGDFDALLDLYYLTDNPISPMVGDIFVGEMLEEISIITAVNYLEEALGADRANDKILQEAYQYGQELAKNRKENYYVTIEFVTLDSDRSIETENVNNQILFKQMILGIILSFLSFFTLFTAISIVKDEENNLVKKLVITKTAKWKIVIGEYFSVVISSCIIALMLSSVLAYFSSHFLKTFFLDAVVFLLFICTFSAFTMFMAKQFKNVSSFVILGAVSIMIMGIISGCFFSIDLTLPIIKRVAYVVPAYQALNQLLGVVVGGKWIHIKDFVGYSSASTGILLLGTYFFWKEK